MPTVLEGNDDALAYYGVTRSFFEQKGLSNEELEDVSTAAGLEMFKILKKHWKIQFWDDDIAVKNLLNDLDDFFFDEVRGKRGIEITSEEMDEIIEKLIQVAKTRKV